MKRHPGYGFFKTYVKDVLSLTGISVASYVAGSIINHVGVTVIDAVDRTWNGRDQPVPKVENEMNDHSNTPKQS